MISPSFFLAITFLALVVSSNGRNGLTESVSIESQVAFKTAHPCAVNCLWGPYHILEPGNDLAFELSCDTDAVNGCYCNADQASLATSYISACVGDSCTNVKQGALPDEVSTVLEVYDNYCQNAVGEVLATTGEVPAATDGPSTDAPTTTAQARSALLPSSTVPFGRFDATAFAGSNTEASTDPSAGPSGLGKSDVIALGVGLGVGIPSLLLGLIGLCMEMKRRKGKGRHSEQEIQLVETAGG